MPRHQHDCRVQEHGVSKSTLVLGASPRWLVAAATSCERHGDVCCGSAPPLVVENSAAFWLVNIYDTSLGKRCGHASRMRSLVSAKDTSKIFFKRLSLVCLNFSHDVVDRTVTPKFVIRTEVFKTALIIMKAGKEREITRATKKKLWPVLSWTSLITVWMLATSLSPYVIITP